MNDVVQEAGGSAGRAAKISAWEDPPHVASPASASVLAVDGFKGPLDWLLEMAQARKIALTRLSIAALIDAFATALELALSHQTDGLAAELARWGGWLVVAATLAFLRSRLLLPGDSPEAAVVDEAEALRRRLVSRAQVRAIARMRQLLGALPDGSPLTAFLPEVDGADPARALRSRVAISSTLVAGLELVRTGTVALDQYASWTSIRVKHGVAASGIMP